MDLKSGLELREKCKKMHLLFIEGVDCPTDMIRFLMHSNIIPSTN